MHRTLFPTTLIAVLLLTVATIPVVTAENGDGTPTPVPAERTRVWTSILAGHRVEVSRDPDETSFLIGVTLEPGSPLSPTSGKTTAFRLVLDAGGRNRRIAFPLTSQVMPADGRLTFLLTDVDEGAAQLSFDIEVLVEDTRRTAAVIASNAVTVEPLRAEEDPHRIVRF